MDMAKAKRRSSEDWLAALDAELDKKAKDIVKDVGEHTAARGELNQELIGDLWGIWKRFNAIGAHFTLEPSYHQWALFEDTFPDGEWRWRPGFNPATVGAIQLVDRTQDQGRIGDALKIAYYDLEGKHRIKVTFEYCEGEHYYKYSGWKRIWSIHTLYDALVPKVDRDAIHGILGDIVKAWYESHLRRDRDVLLKHMKASYTRVETFNQ